MRREERQYRENKSVGCLIRGYGNIISHLIKNTCVCLCMCAHLQSLNEVRPLELVMSSPQTVEYATKSSASVENGKLTFMYLVRGVQKTTICRLLPCPCRA